MPSIRSLVLLFPLVLGVHGEEAGDAATFKIKFQVRNAHPTGFTTRVVTEFGSCEADWMNDLSGTNDCMITECQAVLYLTQVSEWKEANSSHSVADLAVSAAGLIAELINNPALAVFTKIVEGEGIDQSWIDEQSVTITAAANSTNATAAEFHKTMDRVLKELGEKTAGFCRTLRGTLVDDAMRLSQLEGSSDDRVADLYAEGTMTGILDNLIAADVLLKGANKPEYLVDLFLSQTSAKHQSLAYGQIREIRNTDREDALMYLRRGRSDGTAPV